MSEIRRVYQAYLSGCKTSAEVSAITGLTLKRCSAYSYALVERRLIRKAGFAPRNGERGARCCWYELVPKIESKAKGASA